MMSEGTPRTGAGRIVSRSALAVLALLFCVSVGAADFDGPVRLGADGRAVFERKVSLGTISAAELRLDTPSLNLGKYNGAPASKGLTRPIVRELRDVWQIVLDDSEVAHDLEIEYTIEAPDGSRNALTLADSPDSVLKVRLVPMEEVATRPRDAKHSVVTGGVRLFLYLDDVRHAGAYQGTLRAVVQRR